MITRLILILVSLLAIAPFCSAQTSKTSAVNLRMVTDEAEAVLQILAKRSQNTPITDADWTKVFSSEGYVRLKQRETSLKRSFGDGEFKTFVLSPELLQRAKALADTLERWKHADIVRMADRALAYLPKNARINAKIYPVIKPRENSFVFGLPNDPAIFLYLDPVIGKEKFENTVAHELHHIGYGSTCPSKQVSDEITKLPPEAQTVLNWIGAFGEGFAILAAAGGPDVHPHAVSDADERARWDKDMANFNQDLKKVEKFFLDVMAKRLTETEIRETAFSFFGIQGPWYTVGYKMAVLIEKTYGRDVLIKCMCDQRLLLAKYNQAAAHDNRRSDDQLPLWSTTLVEVLEPPIKPTQTPVELWCGGDDSLTRHMCYSMEVAFESTDDFVTGDGEKPGTLVVKITENVNWKDVGKRTRVAYKVKFTSTGDKNLGLGKGSCWEDDLATCANQIVKLARIKSRKLHAKADRGS